MFQKFYEKRYIKKLRKAMNEHPITRYLALNSIKTSATHDLIKNHISDDFYINVFCGGTSKMHWSEINKNFIINF